MPHAGDAADDAAIWVHPTRPARSAIIGTDKQGGLAVYDLGGRQLHYYANSRPNNVDVRTGFPLAGRRVSLVVASDAGDDSIRVYRLDPATRGLESVAARTLSTGIGAAGLCVYRSSARGKLYAFVGDNSGTVQQWELFGNRSGRVDARKVRSLRLGSTTEGCVADDAHRRLYVAEEDVGIWRYDAEPNGGTTRALVDRVGAGRLDADVEGLAIYEIGRAAGYLIASSQGSDSFAVYDRTSNAYLKSFAIGPGRIDGVTHTDGIDVTSRALGSAFPDGAFVAQDDRNDTGNQNFKLVSWRAIARAGRPRLARVARSPGAANAPAPRRSPSPATGRRFYVDSAAGSDRASGTSAATPWQTLARANKAELRPGDELLLRRNRAWTGALAIDASGTAARRIVVGAFGTGAPPVLQGGSSCVVLSGSYVTLRDAHIRDCSWAGVEVRGASNTIERTTIRGNAAGIYVRTGATRTTILRNRIVGNNRMSVLSSSPQDGDSGAFGVLIHGDATEVAYNTISGSDAFSHDYERDGAAVEIYGGRLTRIHHNFAVDNHAFAELGHPRSARTTIAYNVVRSGLAGSSFVVTRGARSPFGPVRQTRVEHNTVHLTGERSQGFVCHAGCGSGILRLRNNIVSAVWKTGYADAPFDEDYNLYSGGRLQFTKGRHSLVAEPGFVDVRAGNLRLRPSSRAIDSAADLRYRYDFARRPARVDGNGDGRAVPDIGAFEYQRVRR